jgi:hypothetical protein
MNDLPEHVRRNPFVPLELGPAVAVRRGVEGTQAPLTGVVD